MVANIYDRPMFRQDKPLQAEDDGRRLKQNVEAKPKETPSEPPQITPKAKEWAEKNKWFGEDKIMTDAAVSIHQQVVQEGIEVDSDEYYNEVNSRIGKYFPDAFALAPIDDT